MIIRVPKTLRRSRDVRRAAMLWLAYSRRNSLLSLTTDSKWETR